MADLSQSPQAWWLVRGMARRAGVDLPRAVFDGWFSRAELAGLVARCEAGSCAADCLGWLSQGHHPASPPPFCAIRAELSALAPEH